MVGVFVTLCEKRKLLDDIFDRRREKYWHHIQKLPRREESGKEETTCLVNRRLPWITKAWGFSLL